MSTSIINPPAFTQTYTCTHPGCGRVFDRRRDAQRHSQTHDPATKRFACPVPGCGHTTRQKSNLTTHVKTHTNLKDLACPECTFTTGDPAGLIRHRQKKHQYKTKSIVKRIRFASSSLSPVSSSPSSTSSSLPTTPTDASPKQLTFKLESIGAEADHTYSFHEYRKQNATYLLPAHDSALQSPTTARTTMIVPAFATSTQDMTMNWDWTPRPEVEENVYKYVANMAYDSEYDAPLDFGPEPAVDFNLDLAYEYNTEQWEPSKLEEMQKMFGLDTLSSLDMSVSPTFAVSPTFDSYSPTDSASEVYSPNEAYPSSEVFSLNGMYDATYPSTDMGSYATASYPSAQVAYSPSNELQLDGFYASDGSYLTDGLYAMPASESGPEAYPSPQFFQF